MSYYVCDNYKIVSGQTLEPALDIDDVRRQVRRQDDCDDTILETLADTVRDHFVNIYGRASITANFEAFADCFPGSGRLYLPVNPLVSGTVVVSYYDTDGVLQTLDTAIYNVGDHSDPAFIELSSDQSWPDIEDRGGAVKIAFSAGYGDSESDVPLPLKQAMLVMLNHWYENREAMLDVKLHEVDMLFGHLMARYWKPHVE